MKNKQLIAKLQREDPESTVVLTLVMNDDNCVHNREMCEITHEVEEVDYEKGRIVLR